MRLVFSSTHTPHSSRQDAGEGAAPEGDIVSSTAGRGLATPLDGGGITTAAFVAAIADGVPLLVFAGCVAAEDAEGGLRPGPALEVAEAAAALILAVVEAAEEADGGAGFASRMARSFRVAVSATP